MPIHTHMQYTSKAKMEKVCSSCRATKPTSDFYPKRAKCKACVCAAVAKRGKKRYQEAKDGPQVEKVCSSCNLRKSPTEFTPSKNQCNACINERRSKHRQTPEGNAVMQKQNTSASHKTARLKWQRSSKGKDSARKRNKDQSTIRKNDPGRRLEHNIMIAVGAMVNGKRDDDSRTMREYTGFKDRHAIRTHLASLFVDGMSFANYARDTWHIGHRIPRAAYEKSSPIDIRRCWDPRNIFPQWASENLSLGAKLPDTNTLLALRDLWPTSWNDTLPSPSYRAAGNVPAS